MVISGYLGAVIGAGFASGQEIVQFFVSYGSAGLNGAMLAALLFGISGALLMRQAHKLGVSRYQLLLAHNLNARIARLVDGGLAIFLFLGISTMLSASGAVAFEHLYLPKGAGILAAYIVVLAFLLGERKGLFLSYKVLVPLKIILLLAVAGWVAFSSGNMIENQGEAGHHLSLGGNWLLSSLLYVAYNFSLAMVVLCEYQSASKAAAAVQGGWWGGILLGGLVIICYLALSRFIPVVMHYEVPMLYVAGQISLQAKHLYTMVLWMGIITTAIANTYGFSQRMADFTGLDYRWCLVMSMTLAVPLSLQSFSHLVGNIYPLFGLLGLLIAGSLWVSAGKDIVQDMYYNIMKRFLELRR